MSVDLIARLRVDSARESDLRAVLERLVAETRRGPGNLEYRAFGSREGDELDILGSGLTTGPRHHAAAETSLST